MSTLELDYRSQTTLYSTDSVNPDQFQSTKSEKSTDETSQSSNILCNPNGIVFKLFGLFLMCFVCFGNYFSYDSPGAIQEHFERDLKITTSTFTTFYTMYSFPNVIFCFLGGYFLDKYFGLQLGGIIYASIVFFGQTLFAFGAYTNSIWQMNFGRALLGIGSESLITAQNSYVVIWFMGKYLNLVCGLLLSFSRIGSTLNLLFTPFIYELIGGYVESGSETLSLTLAVAAFFCFVSLLFAVALALMESKRAKADNAILASETIELRDILHFPVTLWLLVMACFSFYCSVFTFVSLGKMFFIRKYDLSSQDASQANSLVYMMSAFGTPISGYFLDVTGHNTKWLIFSGSLGLVAHMLLTFTYANPFIGASMLGVSLSIFAAALWPLVALIVDQNKLGTAYGLLQCTLNFGLGVFAIASGYINEYAGYFVLQLAFMGMMLLSLVGVVFLFMVDNYNDGILGLSPSQRKKKLKEKQASSSVDISKSTITMF